MIMYGINYSYMCNKLNCCEKPTTAIIYCKTSSRDIMCTLYTRGDARVDKMISGGNNNFTLYTHSKYNSYISFEIVR